MKFLEISNLVLESLIKAKTKFPEWPIDPVHAAAIVVEEAGELQQAALQYCYEDGGIEQIKKEALHTAAMAFRILQNIETLIPGKANQIMDNN